MREYGGGLHVDEMKIQVRTFTHRRERESENFKDVSTFRIQAGGFANDCQRWPSPADGYGFWWKIETGNSFIITILEIVKEICYSICN